MKLLVTGDWHIRGKKPKNRTDDFIHTQESKINFILETAANYSCRYILQPGDFFDSYQISDFLKQHYIHKFKQPGVPTILSILGQHDMRYHSSDKNNTPLKVMDSAQVVVLLGSDPFHDLGNFHIYGASWNEEIPKIEDKNKYNILALHKMIVNDKLWAKQEGHTYGYPMLKNHAFDLIVSGDNHTSFKFEYGGKYLLNCGSLMRTNIDQGNHKPVIYIIDTEDPTDDLIEIEIPIAQFEEVFDLTKAEEEQEKNEELEAFIAGLKDEDVELQGLNFRKNVTKYMEANSTSQGIKDIIDEVLA